MEFLNQLLCCCRAPGPSFYLGDEELVMRVGDSDNVEEFDTSNPLASNKVTEDESGILNSVLNILTKDDAFHEWTETTCKEALREAVRILPARVQCVLVVRLLSTWRSGIEGNQRNVRTFEYVQCLVNTLTPEQQQEMFDILTGLPSSVLGDRQARDQTRVFLNIRRDARNSQAEERRLIPEHLELVDTIRGMAFQLLDKYVPQSSVGDIVASLLDCLSSEDRFRIVLQEVIARSKKLPANGEERQTYLQDLFDKVEHANSKLPVQTKDKES